MLKSYKRSLPRLLVRGGARHWQNIKCQTEMNIWSWAPDGTRHQDGLADSSSVVKWLWLVAFQTARCSLRKRTLRTSDVCPYAAHTRSIMLRKIVLRNTSLPIHDQVNQHHTRSIMLHNTQCCATWLIVYGPLKRRRYDMPSAVALIQNST
jgi:hypothetical protein